MDQREQMNQPEQEAAREPRQRTQAARSAQDNAIRVESLRSTLRKLDGVEEKLNTSARVPFRNNMSMVNVGDLLNLLSEVRSELPAAVKEAVEVLRDKEQIILEAQQRAQEMISLAEAQARQTVETADAQAKNTVESANAHAADVEHQAHVAAENILMQANAEAQMRTEESEIVRRAHARAKEIYDQVKLDTDGIYKSAHTEVNRMLSGAAAALNRSAIELAGLRDQLLSQNGDQIVR